MKIFLDFDRTLYDLDAFHERAEQSLLLYGVTKAQYQSSRKFFSRGSNMAGSVYTPEIHEQVLDTMAVRYSEGVASCIRAIAEKGRDFVFSDVQDFFDQTKEHERIILTFGDTEYQQYKIRGAGLEERVESIVVTAGSKWEIIALSLATDERAVFIDDSKEYFMKPYDVRVMGIHVLRSPYVCEKESGCLAEVHVDSLDKLVLNHWIKGLGKG